MRTKLPHLSFEVTSACNLNCRYCYNIWKIPGTKNFEHYNSYRKAKKALKQIFKTIQLDHITFTGGEPLMAERFPELVLYARMKGKTVTVISNGNYPDLNSYKQLVDLGVGLFELPIHSATAKAHDFMTNKKDSWKKSVKTIKALTSFGARQIVAVVVITKANFMQMAETLEFINRLNISSVMLNRFNIGGEGIAQKDNLLLKQHELAKAFETAAEAGRRLKLSLSSNVCTPLCVLNPKDYKGIRFTTCSMDVAGRPITIDANGNLRYCNHSPVLLGNIFNAPVAEIFNSQKAKDWNDCIPDFCSSCKVYDKCMAGCRAASEQLGLPLSKPDPIIEFAGYNLNQL